MPIYLRQSTASQEIPLGYFVDSTDGNTEETALTIANTDIKLWLTGATTFANKTSGGATHVANGLYYCVLDATDTATIGPLVVFVHVSGALSVRVECCVLDEAVYDVMFGTTAPATATNITAGTISTVTTLTGHTPQTGDSYAIVNSGTHGNAAIKGYVDDIGAAGAGLTAIPWNAAWDAEVQSECTDSLNAYDPPTNAEMEARTLVSAGYASPTNITAGTITTVTNLTNAATSGDLTATMKTSVNTEVLDVIAVDTTTQPSAVLSATPTIKEILQWLGTLSRNKRTQSTSTETLYADNGSTTIATSAKSDSASVLTRSEWS